MSFNFNNCESIQCEIGASNRLGNLCRQRRFRSVLIITDPGIVQLDLHKGMLNSFAKTGVNVTLFSDVKADPSEQVVLDASLQAQHCQADAVIGFGGGSSMDVAKLVALLAHPECEQSLADIYGIEKANGKRLPLIQIPTTSGTGSEVTPVAIVTTRHMGKMGVVSPLLLPDLALLDAGLTIDLPPAITAATGIDAMVHAIEAYTSRIKKNPLSDMYAREALRLLAGNISQAVHNGSDINARENMLLGAMLAGQAFANAPVGAVHALAYPLGSIFHIPHGLSNSLVLTEVMRFNLDAAEQQYAELANIIFPDILAGNNSGKALALIQGLEKLIVDLNLPTRLSDLDITSAALRTLASDAMKQQRLLTNNPKEMSEQDAFAIYQAVL
ncbi:iron-containing alcohol dehydrogenase [Bacterioplanoides sp.]|uniref:iron-containing alcohol dehydrogenase n=1 Tax=Bacterioplanoides sp. TaxID=2066072 RepID=UPI003B5CD1E6